MTAALTWVEDAKTRAGSDNRQGRLEITRRSTAVAAGPVGAVRGHCGVRGGLLRLGPLSLLLVGRGSIAPGHTSGIGARAAAARLAAFSSHLRGGDRLVAPRGDGSHAAGRGAVRALAWNGGRERGLDLGSNSRVPAEPIPVERLGRAQLRRAPAGGQPRLRKRWSILS